MKIDGSIVSSAVVAPSDSSAPLKEARLPNVAAPDAFQRAAGGAPPQPLRLQDGIQAPRSRPVSEQSQVPGWIRRFDPERAVRTLEPLLGRTSDPAALRTAVTAYARFLAEKPGEVKKPYLYFVDYGLSNSTPRAWVIDMSALTIVDGPFTAAHGGGSGPRNGVPDRFADSTWPNGGSGSNATALGLYTTDGTYEFHGKSNGKPYTSVGLRLSGHSDGFNDNAGARGIVAHGAPYVTARDAGRSQGCPAMEMDRAERLLPLIREGAVVFLYSPNAERWLAGDPWVNGAP